MFNQSPILGVDQDERFLVVEASPPGFGPCFVLDALGAVFIR